MREEAFGELGGGSDDVLAVVEDEEQAAVGAVFDEARGGVGGGRGRGLAGDEGALAQAEGAEDGAGNGSGVVQAGEFDDPAGFVVGRGGVFGEAGLSRTAGAGEGDEAQPGQVGVEGGEFGLAADEGGQAGAEVPAEDLGPGFGPGFGPGLGPRLRRKRRLLRLRRRCLRCLRAEEFRVQGGEFGAGIGAESVGEGAPRGLVRGEGIGRAARGAQGPELLRAQCFVVRRLLDQGLDLGQECRRGGGAAAQVRLDALADGAGAPGLGDGRTGCAGGLGQVGEGGSAPEREGGAQGAGGGLGVGGQFLAAPDRQPVEPVQVDVLAGGGQEVAAGGGRVDAVAAAEGAAEPGDKRLEGGGGVLRRVVAPDVVDEFGDGGRAPGPEGEGGEERAQAGAADGKGGAGLVARLGDAQDEIPHRAILPGPFGWWGGAGLR